MVEKRPLVVWSTILEYSTAAFVIMFLSLVALTHTKYGIGSHWMNLVLYVMFFIVLTLCVITGIICSMNRHNRKEINEVIGRLSDQFDSSVLVDISKNSFKKISVGEGSVFDNDKQPFSEVLTNYIGTCVDARDRESVFAASRLDNIRQSIASGRKVKVQFREISSGRPIWTRMTFTGVQNSDGMPTKALYTEARVDSVQAEKTSSAKSWRDRRSSARKPRGNRTRPSRPAR